MIYIEYISRRPGVDLATFHAAVAQGQEGWDSAYAEDQLVWSAGRTWRMGPEPEYVGVWHSPGFGFERIDGWERIFRAEEADRFEQPFAQAARIDAAGCYEALLEPVRARDGTYYAEFFRARAELEAVRTFFAERMQRHRRFTLNLLVHRIGRLGPEPGGLAVWTLPDFASLGEIAQELDGVQQPVELVAAGTYADIGREIL
jgi:hypothetical protein